MPRKNVIYFRYLLTAFFASTPAIAAGDFWRDIGRVIAAPITVPIEATKNVIEGKDPTRPVADSFGALGRTGNSLLEATQKVHGQIAAIPRDAVQRNLGGDWIKAYDTITAGQRVQQEMAFTSGRFLGGCLQGQPCNVNQLVAMPVAASLRDVYKVYIGRSQPLDMNVQRILSRVVPWQTLANTRVIVTSTPDMTIPGFLNAGYRLNGQSHAVTVANLIIFSRPVNYADLNDWNWLLHEIRHVEQYQSFSNDPQEAIDGFAVNYIQHFNGLENDAQQAADQRQAQLNYACQYGC